MEIIVEADTSGFAVVAKQLESERGQPHEKPAPAQADTSRRLRSIVDRIVRLTEEKKSLAGDIKDIYDEAKSAGFDVKALRIVVKRTMEDEDDKASREDAETIAQTMLAALGNFAYTPLGTAAMAASAH